MNYRKIDITVRPQIVHSALISKHICSCGLEIVNEEVPLNKHYAIDIDSIRWVRWECHGCGKKFDVRIVDAYSDIAFMPIQWFFLDLLDIGAGIRETAKPRHWEKVRRNEVTPKGFSREVSKEN